MKKLVASAALGLSMLIASPTFAAYEVKSGDTMGEIAKDNGVTLNEIGKANPQIKNIDLIFVGQDVHLPGEKRMVQPKIESKVKAPKVVKEESQKSYKTVTVKATAYTAYCYGCSGVTATGIDLRSNPNQKVIAVDPSVIPLGSRVYVEGYGYAIAGDTGGAIKGNRIDLFMPSQSDAVEFGRKTVEVKVFK